MDNNRYETNSLPRCRVITYRGAYTDKEVDLCEVHDNDRDAPFPLGPVQHGGHQGLCYRCERLARAGK